MNPILRNKLNKYAKTVINCNETECPLHKSSEKDKEYIRLPFEGKGVEIMLVGLNPKLEMKSRKFPKKFNKILDKHYNYFDTSIHNYFTPLKSIFENSEKVFKEKLINTELVKCKTEKWTNSCKKAICYCNKYLKKQIKIIKPKIIICNGVPVCNWFRKEYNLKEDTSGVINMDGKKITIIFSGFIGRIDTYSKLRIKKELKLHFK
jgi:uracil-DNA glycosylase